MEIEIILLLVFFVGTILLSLTRYERFFGLFFLIRTRHFIPIIDKVAKLSPKIWKFLADLSVVVFFGGLGAAYLSRYRRTEKNLDAIIFLIGLAAIVLWWPGWLAALLSLLLLTASVKALSEARNITADFMFSSILSALVFTKLVELIAFFLGSGLSAPLYLALIEGFLGIPPLLVGMFALQAYQIVFMGSEMPGVSPMLPAVRDGNVGVGVPGYPIFVPIAYAVIAFTVLLFSHEFAHGVLARVHKIKLKSTGLLSVGIIPIGAFVEPDEEELRDRRSIQKMHVYSAGSFANLLVCLFAGVVLLFISFFLVSSEGLVAAGVPENSTAYGVVSNGTLILSVNGVNVSSYEEYVGVLSNTAPGSVISLETANGTYNLSTIPDPRNQSRAYTGMLLSEKLRSNFGIDLGLLNFVWATFIWMLFFNFNVALVNLLPLAPFDGSKMLLEIMTVFSISPETARKVVYGIFMLNIFLLAVNVLPLFAMILGGL